MFGGLSVKNDDKKEEKEASAPAASAFSFLSTPAPAPAAPAPATSGFSFMNASPAPTEEVPKPEKAEEPPPAPASSAFDFLKPTEVADAPPAPAAAPSSFDFMQNAAATSETATTSMTSPDAFKPPTGVGISFGKAAKPVTKKKKTRTARVGVEAQGSVAVPMSIPEPVRMPEPTTTTTTTATTTPPLSTIPSVDSEDSDNVLAAATAAAQEAQRLQPKQRFLGGLFRGRQTTSPAPTKGIIRSGSSTSSLDPPLEVSSSKPLEIPIPQSVTLKDEDNKPALPPLDIPKPVAAASIPSTAATAKPPIAPVVSAPTLAPAAPPKPTTKLTMGLPRPSFTVTKPAAEPPTPLPQTPTHEFQDLLDDFFHQVQDRMAQVTSLRQQRVGLQEQRFLLQAKERLALDQERTAELASTAAAEAEDFEEAHRQTTLMEQCVQQRAEYASILSSVQDALQELDSQKESTVQAVSACFGNVQTKLKEFLKNQQKDDATVGTDVLKKYAATSQQISAEQERLEQDLKHIERDEKLVEEEAQELEVSIAEQSSGFSKLQDEAQAQLQVVEIEMEELRKQLQAKQAQAAQLRTEVAGHEEAVIRVRVKFTRQLDRVQKKRSTIQDNREEFEQEKEANERQKSVHDAKVKAHSEALLARDTLLESLHREIELADTFESIVAKEMNFEDGEKQEMSDDMAELQAQVVKRQGTLQEATEALSQAEKAMSSLETELSTLQARIPQLEEQKKAAAAKRDFKTAGKASKEAKEAAARVAECQNLLTGEALEARETAQTQVSECKAALEEAQAQAHEKEKDSAIQSMKSLADNVQRLCATKKSVCGKATEGVTNVGAFVLNAQIQALILEGKSLDEKYGGWDELVGDCLEEETAEELATTMTPTTNGDAVTEETPAAEASTEATTTEPTTTGDDGDREEKMEQFRQLTQRLQTVEKEIEVAAEAEDYEKAAELDEELQTLLSSVQALSLSDRHMELALAKSFEEPEKTPETTNDAAEDPNPAESIDAVTEEPSDPVRADNKETVESPEAQESTVADTKKNGVEGDSDSRADPEQDPTADAE